MMPSARAVGLSALALALLAAGLLHPERAVAQEEQLLYQTRTALCDARVEANRKWSTIRLRLSRGDDGRPCALTREETVDILARAFASLNRRRHRAYGSFVLGRIEDYAWLRGHLEQTAAADAGWSRAEGRPAAGGSPNAYVEAVLARPAILQSLDRAAAQAERRFGDFSCEKVLISEDGLPFDAFCGAALAR